MDSILHKFQIAKMELLEYIFSTISSDKVNFRTFQILQEIGELQRAGCDGFRKIYWNWVGVAVQSVKEQTKWQKMIFFEDEHMWKM